MSYGCSKTVNSGAKALVCYRVNRQSRGFVFVPKLPILSHAISNIHCSSYIKSSRVLLTECGSVGDFFSISFIERDFFFPLLPIVCSILVLHKEPLMYFVGHL